MKKRTHHILVVLLGATSLVFASCSSTSKSDNYATYPSSGYGNYGATDAYDSSSNNVTQQEYASSGGGGGAYPTTPQDYGSAYGASSGGASTTSTPTTSSGQTHTVQKGETLYRIGQNYGTTAANIKAANGLTSDLIRPGDVLVVR